VLEIRHLANAGRLDAGAPGLGEQSALTLAALAFSLGLQRVARNTGSLVYRHASLAAGVAGAVLIAIAHLVTANPFLTGEDVGDGWFLNLLLPAYLLPALLAAWVSAAARNIRPRWYVRLLAGLALALAFAYITLMVRRGFSRRQPRRQPQRAPGSSMRRTGPTRRSGWRSASGCWQPASWSARRRYGPHRAWSSGRWSARCSCSTWPRSPAFCAPFPSSGSAACLS
jgi:hypothetical protein